MAEAGTEVVALSVKKAQDAIAATIPEIERISWTCFTISRDLGPPEGEDFPAAAPLPEKLRWSTSLSAIALYEELQECIALARRAAQRTELDLEEEARREKRFADGFGPALEPKRGSRG